MRNIRLVCRYDGTGFHGWQRQPGRMTVQEVIETALFRMTGEAVTLAGSGRTDAGVHALAQVASFRTSSRIPSEGFVRGLNSLLPGGIVILSAEEVPPGFHALRDAIGKLYRYHIVVSPVRDPFWGHRAWVFPRSLDAASMGAAAAHLVGTHDFSAFQASGGSARTSVRTVFHASLEPCPCPFFPPLGGSAHYVFSIAADGFLRYMVRNIVGTLVDVGTGRIESQSIPDIIKSRDRSRAGMTAPPFGLYLERVFYLPEDIPMRFP